MRMVGDPTTCTRVFNERNADELIFLDIVASRENTSPNFGVIEDIAHECLMPLNIGGGIRTIEDADRLFEIGADKITINTSAVKCPELIVSISDKYGAQSLSVSIDAMRVDNRYKAFICSGKEETEYSPSELAMKAEALGAGEILLNSIDEDGRMNGFDLNLIKEVTDAINIPLVAAGGCGKLQDFVEAVTIGGANSVSAASIFFFAGESIITIKNFLNEQGIPVRLK